MIEIKITEKSPLDALASLTAFGMYCQGVGAVKDAAKCILGQDARKNTHASNTENPADTSAPAPASMPGAQVPQQPAAAASAPAAAPVSHQPATPAQAPAQMQMSLNTPQTPAPAPQQPMMPPAQVPTAAAPVAAPAAYTLEQLQHAAGELVRTNKREALTALLVQFNVPSLIQLPKEQYGAFATALRGIGAMI